MAQMALIASPTASHPTTSGNRRRIIQVGDALKAAGFECHYLWYAVEWSGRISADALEQMEQYWDRCFIVSPPATFSLNPPDGQDTLDPDLFWGEALSSMVRWCDLNFDYSLYWSNYVLFSKGAALITNRSTVSVIDTHDILGDRHKIFEQHSLPRQFYYLSVADEIRAAKRADHVVAIQNEEAEYFRAHGVPSVHEIGYVPQPVAASGGRAFTAPLVVGFIGGGNGINLAALKSLIARMTEADRASDQTIILRVAGSICALLPLEQLPFVEVCGRVEAVSDFYASVDAIVCPLEFGSGLKIKAVEALAYGKPVLAVQHAFKGIQSDHREHNFPTVQALVAALYSTAWSAPALADMARHSASVFDRYRRGVMANFDAFFASLADARPADHAPAIQCAERMTDIYEWADAEDCAVYIFGAGMGFHHIISTAPRAFVGRIKGVLDSFKDRSGVEGIPLLQPDAIDLPKGNNAVLLLTILNKDEEKVYQTIKHVGFDRIFSLQKILSKIFVE